MTSCDLNVVLTETCICSNDEVCDASILTTKACVAHNGASACLNVITEGSTTNGACALTNAHGVPVTYIPDMDC